MNMVKQSQRRLNYRTKQQLRNIALAVVTLMALTAFSTMIGILVSINVKISMALTDDVIISVYLTGALLLFLLVSFLLPRPRR